MPYQLPPELKTNKLESLPSDLRKIADQMLADKFKLDEVVKPKKKKTVAESLMDIPLGPMAETVYHRVEVGMRTGYSVQRRMFAVNEYDDPGRIHKMLNDNCRRLYEDMRYQRGGPGGHRTELIIWFNGVAWSSPEGARPPFEQIIDAILKATRSQGGYNSYREYEEREQERMRNIMGIML